MRPTFISEFLIIEILYFLKMCPIFIGSVDNFGSDISAAYIYPIDFFSLPGMETLMYHPRKNERALMSRGLIGQK